MRSAIIPYDVRLHHDSFMCANRKLSERGKIRHWSDTDLSKLYCHFHLSNGQGLQYHTRARCPAYATKQALRRLRRGFGSLSVSSTLTLKA